MKKKSFKEMPPLQRVFTLVLIGISVGIVTAAERDLQRRPADEVRGEKWLWRLLCLNAVGAVSYFRWGRLQG
ncbi:MAG TPA: hypothetical protein VH817_13365 [Thermoleophilaceae bacterium]|jgi:hypothetical protein